MHWQPLLVVLAVKIGGPVLLVLAFILIKNKWRSMGESRADSWPSASGHVFEATVAPMQSGSRSMVQVWEATIVYNYHVNEYQAGTYKKIFMKERAADDFAAACRGKDIQVRYDPRDETKSVLRGDDLRLIIPISSAPSTDPYDDQKPSIWRHVRTMLRPFI